MGVRDFFNPHIDKRAGMIHQSNLVTYWVVQQIVEAPDADERMRTLKKIVEIAVFLQDSTLKNLHGFMAVMTALQLSPVRLRITAVSARIHAFLSVGR